MLPGSRAASGVGRARRGRTPSVRVLPPLVPRRVPPCAAGAGLVERLADISPHQHLQAIPDQQVQPVVPHPPRVRRSSNFSLASAHLPARDHTVSALYSIDYDENCVRAAFKRSFGSRLTRCPSETLGVRAPNQNAVAEHFVQSVQHECLDHFVVFSAAHLRHILSEYLVFYHRHRPHQGLGNRPLG